MIAPIRTRTSVKIDRLAHRLVPVAAALAVLVAAAPRAEARRVGFANVARDGQAAHAAIDANRKLVVRKAGGEDLSSPQARAALEEPLADDAADDAAAVQRARALIAAARASLKGFAYDDALDQLRQADATLRALLPSPDVSAELYEASLLAGQVYAARGDEARALDAFRLARRLFPERKALDPARYRPQLVALYDRADADVGTGSFHVVTEPPGVTVWVDGRPAGTSPLEPTGLGAGEHYLGLGLEGHVARHERIVVGKATRSEQSYLLARLPAEQRARALRASLTRPERSEADYRRVAAQLADVASVDVLVLVRDRAGGGVEAASWDARQDKLGPWVGFADGGERLAATLPPIEADAIALPPPTQASGRLTTDDTSEPRTPQAKPHWYRTWWGVSLIIAGGVLATSALLLATTPDGTAAPDSLVVTNPHWSDGAAFVGTTW